MYPTCKYDLAYVLSSQSATSPQQYQGYVSESKQPPEAHNRQEMKCPSIKLVLLSHREQASLQKKE